MLRQTSLLVSLVTLVDRLPWPPAPITRLRGRPKIYSDRLIVKAVVIMIIRRLYTAYALLAFLDQDDPLPQQLRPLLYEQGRFPTRRTWERRLAALPQTLPGLIGCVGRHLVEVLNPWASHGRAVAVDSTPLKTSGGGSGTRSTRKPGRFPIRRLTPKRGGRSPGGTAGGMVGSCIWRCRSGRSGFHWPQN